MGEIITEYEIVNLARTTDPEVAEQRSREGYTVKAVTKEV